MNKSLPGTPSLDRLLHLAARGEPEAQYELALLYLRGHGVAHDPAEARRWLRLAAQQGHAPSVSLMTGIPQGHVVNGTESRPGFIQTSPGGGRR